MNKFFVLLFAFFMFPLLLCFSQMCQPGSACYQQDHLTRMKAENPKLYKYEERIADIQREIKNLLRQYGRINKSNTRKFSKQERLDQIKEKIKSLLKELAEIKNSPDYQVELTIFHGSRPKF
jgi:peptidoglycan hydrolase CwlO-like protein